MKQRNFLSSFILSICVLFVMSCTNPPEGLNPNNSPSEEIIQNTQWKVSWFWDKDKDETSDFNGYSFLFDADGTLTAEKNGQMVKKGTWSVRTSSNSTNKLVISIGNVKPLKELTDDWIILKMTDTKIELKDDNDQHLEELHLEKN